MPEQLSIEYYDAILDALDSEDTNKLMKLFAKFELEPYSELLDAPRFGNINTELNTYLDYILYYNLSNVIDIFIDELNLSISDETLAQCITLHNYDMYNYLISLGYFPESETFKKAVQHCCANIVYNILENDNDLINYLDEDDIECIFNTNIDEETIETIRVLFNYGVDSSLFSEYIEILKKYDIGDNDDEQKDIILEIIELLESSNIKN